MKSQSAQAEEKTNKKNELLYAFVRPTSKQWYRSGNMFPKCPPSRRKSQTIVAHRHADPVEGRRRRSKKKE